MMSAVDQQREAYVQQKIEKEGVRTLATARKRWAFGLFGAHKFYLNRIGSGLAILTCTCIAIFTLASYVGMGFFAVGLIWWILDYFRLPKLVEEANVVQYEYYKEEAERRIH